jgi:capsular polysaccharide transport system permease protein
MIDAYFETSAGTVIVRASAFSPQDAYAIARLMLADSEALIKRMSKRARDDSVAFAEKEVSAAEARLAEVRKKARALQDKEAILDPMKSAEVNITLTAKLREQIAQQSAELATQKLRLSPTAPSVRASEESIAGLKRELQRIRAEATAARGSRAAVDDNGAARPLSTVFGAFQQLEDEKTFAEKAYLSALAALETARLDANRQQV